MHYPLPLSQAPSYVALSLGLYTLAPWDILFLKQIGGYTLRVHFSWHVEMASLSHVNSEILPKEMKSPL